MQNSDNWDNRSINLSMQREFFFLSPTHIPDIYIYIRIVELIRNRVYVPLHETQFGAGDGWPTLSNEIFKSDNPTEPPSHEPSFHSVISSLPRSGYPGGRGKYRVRRAPIDRPNRIKGNIEDSAKLLSFRRARDVSLATSMDLLFLFLFFWGKREEEERRKSNDGEWEGLLLEGYSGKVCHGYRER